MNVEDFIKNVLIKEIGDIKSNHPFLAFNLICSGIEFLGKCLKFDIINDFDDGNSYFKNTIVELFPENYHKLKNILWNDLRNGMIHILLPKSKIGLSEKRHDMSNLISYQNHPYEQGSQYVLIIEYFYDDFVGACNKVIKQKPDLMEQNILSIPKA
jgi:hypothetical protein